MNQLLPCSERIMAISTFRFFYNSMTRLKLIYSLVSRFLGFLKAGSANEPRSKNKKRTLI